MLSDDITLTRAELRRSLEEGICPFCNRGPWVSVGQHAAIAHGVKANRLREMAGYNRRHPLCSVDHSQRMHDIAELRPSEFVEERTAELMAWRNAHPGMGFPSSDEKREHLAESLYGTEVWERARRKISHSVSRAHEDGRFSSQTKVPEVEYQAIADLYRSGMTMREIAVHYGVSEQPIRRALNALGVPKRASARRIKVSHGDALEMAARHASGESVASIARSYGLAHLTASNAIKRVCNQGPE